MTAIWYQSVVSSKIQWFSKFYEFFLNFSSIFIKLWFDFEEKWFNLKGTCWILVSVLVYFNLIFNLFGGSSFMTTESVELPRHSTDFVLSGVWNISSLQVINFLLKFKYWPFWLEKLLHKVGLVWSNKPLYTPPPRNSLVHLYLFIELLHFPDKAAWVIKFIIPSCIFLCQSALTLHVV